MTDGKILLLNGTWSRRGFMVVILAAAVAPQQVQPVPFSDRLAVHVRSLQQILEKGNEIRSDLDQII